LADDAKRRHVRKAWGPETVLPQPPPTTSPLIRRIKGLNPKTQAEQGAAEAEVEAQAEVEAEVEAVAEARKKFAAEDAAVAAKRPSRGNVVAYDDWKKTQQDHPEYKNLEAIADAGKLRRIDEMNAKLGPEKGPSYRSIREGKEAALDRANAKLPPTPPLTGSPSPRKTSRTLKQFGSIGGGNKQRTRKRQRIASTHHHTKRRILRNKNHKHTRKARLVRASGSV